MEFNDRRPGKGQLNIFGGEYRGDAEPAGKKSPPRDPALARRLATRTVAHSRWRSDAMRTEDEVHPELDRYGTHPKTGLPRAGLLPVSELGIETRNPPDWASYHGSVKSARAKYAEYREVPIQSAAGVTIRTHQPEVSAQRLNDMIEHPEKASHPRFGRQELPYAYHDPWIGEHTVVDGTHRTAKAVHENQMFQPMRVFDDRHKAAMQEHTERVEGHRQAAERRTGVDPWEVISERQMGMGRNYF